MRIQRAMHNFLLDELLLGIIRVSGVASRERQPSVYPRARAVASSLNAFAASEVVHLD
ncbi:MAG: hypothetical protein M1343_10910 [Chloroflexi bacterium]|nr:hypothetical protein [Chloroflexota bacterium]